MTFDDFAKSSWHTGGPILARHDAFATFYVSGSLCGRRIDGVEYYDARDLEAVHAGGHEIGSHTFAHHRVHSVGSRELVADIAKNESFIQEYIGDVIPETFAYPFAETSLRTKILFSRHFACCRGGEFGVNRGLLDLGQLKAVQLDRRTWQMRPLDQAIAIAMKAPSWLVLLLHDISDTPSLFGVTLSMFGEVLGKLRAAGMDILTMKNGLARACFGR